MWLKLLISFLIANNMYINLLAQEIDPKSSILLNGRLYQESRLYQENIGGHPFFIDNKFYSSNIVYKGMTFDNLLIKYDLLNQHLIYYQNIDEESPRFILLNNNYLDRFELTVSSHKLVFTNEYSDLKGLISDIKYYQLIYDGKYKYIKGSIKTIDELPVYNRTKEYIEKSYYYLIVNDKPYRIKRKRDFLLIFDVHKKALRKYIKTNRLNIKVWSHADIVKLIVFCESLNEI